MEEGAAVPEVTAGEEKQQEMHEWMDRKETGESLVITKALR